MIGPTYPLTIGDDGKIVSSSDSGVLASSWIRQYDLTRPGGRPMRPTWGAGLQGLFFDPYDDISKALATRRLKDAQAFLPVVIDRVGFIDVGRADGKLVAEEHFRVLTDMATEHSVTLAEE